MGGENVCVFTQIPHIHKYIAAHFAESEGFLQPTPGGYVKLYMHIFQVFLVKRDAKIEYLTKC